MTPLCERLSPREEEVLLLLADGFGVNEIARRLGITSYTVKAYRANARYKLGAATTAQAVAILARLRAVA